VRSFNGSSLLAAAIGTTIGIVLLVVAREAGESYAESNASQPIVCIQDAPVTYDWNNNLIVEKMHE